MNMTQSEESNTAPANSASPDAVIAESYRVWAIDNQVYGPVPLDNLVEWAQDARVLPDTWVYVSSQHAWKRADALSEVRGHFSKHNDTLFLSGQTPDHITVDPKELRMFPAMAALSSSDLAHFIRLAQLLVVEPGEFVIRRREPGDAIFFVLSGKVRVRLVVGYDEKVLGDVGLGHFFGEMSMFTNTARAADVIAQEKTRLLRFSAEAFRHLITDNPSAAAPLLYSISTAMAQRILDTNERFQNEVAGGFVWR